MGWTSTSISKLKNLWEKGLSTSEIGVKLGLSKNAIVGKAHRLGLKSRASATKKIKRKIQKPVRKEILATPEKLQTVSPADISEKKVTPPASKKKKNGKIISILDLKPDMCRWPMGDPRSEDFSFCGEKTFGKKPYCLKHCSEAYTVSNSKEKEKQHDDSQDKSE
ncbi:MAG: global cell cycle regulator GcrA-like protein [Alphaproteobacteria bacterium]|nr:global cell cycle regulator GcrA-like protein [Alphaproteobacteria bacterium]